MNEKTARKAAKWWADQLRNPAILDNGDNSIIGAMTFAMATLLQGKERDSQDAAAVDRFEDELAMRLLKMDGEWISFGVDYNPDYTLQSAADAAQLPLGMTTLPWKTNMYINGEVIKVALGYGADPVEI